MNKLVTGIGAAAIIASLTACDSREKPANVVVANDLNAMMPDAGNTLGQENIGDEAPAASEDGQTSAPSTPAEPASPKAAPAKSAPEPTKSEPEPAPEPSAPTCAPEHRAAGHC